MTKSRGFFAGVFALILFAIVTFAWYGNQNHYDRRYWIPAQLWSVGYNGTDKTEPAAGGNMPKVSKEVSVQVKSCKADNLLEIRSIINLPAWFRNEKKHKLKKDATLEKLVVTTRGGDREEITAWENFFYGTSGGLMLELGAMNGKDYSVSHFFEASAYWRVILIEANPILASRLAENRPQALNFNVAICGKPGQVHFISLGGLSGMDGILEFMSEGFIRAISPRLLKNLGNGNKTLDLEKVKGDKRVSLVQCLPLASILSQLKVNHLNFFLLDVEGGELNILKAIDFAKITFDVIAVETDRGLDDSTTTKAYVDAVSELLTSKGYVIWTRKLGRNSWFYHPNFTRSVKRKNNTG